MMSVDLQAPCQSVLEAGLASVTGTALTCRVPVSVTALGIVIALIDETIPGGPGNIAPLRVTVNRVNLFEHSEVGVGVLGDSPLDALPPVVNNTGASRPVLVEEVVDFAKSLRDSIIDPDSTRTQEVYYVDVSLDVTGSFSEGLEAGVLSAIRNTFPRVGDFGGFRFSTFDDEKYYEALNRGVLSYEVFVNALDLP